MALALDTRRSAGSALQLLLQREFARAVKRLDQAAESSAKDRIQGVHEFRRSVKRLRAALRLARPVIGGAEHRAIDRSLGDSARRLGALRDAHARTIAAGRIAALLPRAMRALALDAWRATGGAASEAAGGMPLDSVLALVRESRLELEAVRHIVLSLDLGALDWPAVAAALAEGCGAARDRFRMSWRGRDEEWLHDARKRAQRAANLLLLVQPRVGRRALLAERRLREAAGLLGEARDAGLMLEGMPMLPKSSPLHAASRQMRRVAERHRERCLRRARTVGEAALRAGRREMWRRFEAALGASD